MSEPPPITNETAQKQDLYEEQIPIQQQFVEQVPMRQYVQQRPAMSMMYQQQMPAFNARAALIGVVTNSTPDTPPTHPPIDWNEVCQLKRRIVSNLPKTCCHCGAEYPPNSFVDHNGDVMAYCKKKGACGKSLLLFSGIEMSTPVYKKICRFKKPPSDEPEPEPTVNDLAGIRAVEYQMHGLVKPDVICELCHKRYDQHEDAERIARADQNGWVQLEKRQPVPKPKGWPEYNAATHSWVMTEEGEGNSCSIA